MLVRRLARPLLASTFVAGGLDAALHPAGKVDRAEKINAGRFAQQVGLGSTEQLIRAGGAAQLVGGLALVTNRVPRLAALGLAASLVPTTLAGHRFWEQPDAASRATDRTQFLKNLSLLGGLLLAVVDTGGKESVGHKARRKAREAAAALPVG